MYVNPFWAGVAATIIAEILAMFVTALIMTLRKGSK